MAQEKKEDGEKKPKKKRKVRLRMEGIEETPAVPKRNCS